MATRTERDRRERRCADASRRAGMTGGLKPYLLLPKNLPLWQPSKGSHEVSVLPYVVSKAQEKFVAVNLAAIDEWYYERSFYTHRGIGVNEEMHLCSAKTFGEPCCVCEEHAEKRQEPKADRDKLWETYGYSLRQLLLINDHAERDKSKLIQLWDVSNFAFGKQLDSKITNSSPADREKYKNFFDPKGGYDLRIVLEDTAMGRGGSFLKGYVDSFLERKKGLPENLTEHGFELDKMVRATEYKTLKKLFFMESSDESTDDDRDAERNGDGDRDRDEPRSRRKGKDDDDREDDRGDKDRDTDTNSSEPADELKVGNVVDFRYERKDYTGEITGFNKSGKVAYVEVEGEDRPFNIDVEDLTLAEPADDDRDADRDEPRSRRGKEDDDDDRDASRSRRKGKDDDRDADEPRSRRGGKSSKPDDDDAPFGADEDKPKPRSRR